METCPNCGYCPTCGRADEKKREAATWKYAWAGPPSSVTAPHSSGFFTYAGQATLATDALDYLTKAGNEGVAPKTAQTASPCCSGSQTDCGDCRCA